MTVNYVKLQGLEETAVYREEKSGKDTPELHLCMAACRFR